MIERIDIIKRLSTLGYEATSEDDALIDYLIGAVYQSILNDCNINEVPKELKYVAIDMVCGHILQNKLAMGSIDVEKAIKSIKEGDTTVTYADGSDPKSYLSRYYGNLIRNKKLVRFRRLEW